MKYFGLLIGKGTLKKNSGFSDGGSPNPVRANFEHFHACTVLILSQVGLVCAKGKGGAGEKKFSSHVRITQ